MSAHITPKIVAHRGFSGQYPEMSRLAFQKALELPGLFGVECDVRLTLDNRLVLTHDPTMLRTAGSPLRVESSTYQELSKLNISTAPYPPQRIMLLEELIDLVLATDKHLFIETKQPLCARRKVDIYLVDLLQQRGLDQCDRIHIISFSHAALRRIRARVPDLDTYYLRHEWERWFDSSRLGLSQPKGLGLSILGAKLRPDYIVPPSYVFTVNEVEDLIWCRDHKVTIIATDFPPRAMTAVD
ncbi:glycerophosphodiester phosphodiesterase family protein [Corynebacterium sp. ES2794-CONJ1]|uniref:glycerophosphodiester phosphodiesterase family protein n=1 Tax=unclassified Corynebacterium TaxID=2624378 RepID=UPI00216A1495|nr:MULTISPECIES: glycerophosphodiester phosphodiesterase family protein [unclassified Corynebacterium]MCS4490113.1 glycerophosphodiester phosphodiesterase [Corynebacterium sp. ES2775-CONJ]MCS4492078.1 glycerophosphodiester phosphodiesterase [Corynebacterium sp. ES2715-CONJ3]MCS4532186.1 glycerophosphodiester phosphodiesterase [Corynebacterium sp. ES2730-CONJ]MCU9519582.1 glycerophosphodiester phosphodiesterase family protein [Corynebacterium sp. ES2794-CONJ1]